MNPKRKLIASLTILFIFYGGIAKANNYYFSTLIGDDSRTNIQAQNPSTPWKTIKKLNTYFPNLNPGDSILFKRGEIFYGSLIVKKSGSIYKPLVFSAFGLGNNPVINGLATLSNWTPLGNGVYQSSCASISPSEFKLIINGAQRAMGRYPNTEYLTFETHTANSSIVDMNLGSSPNWTNAELVIKKNRWIIDRSRITAHSAHTINYGSSSSDEPINGFGYFIQNDPRTLDKFGEWYFDPMKKNMQVYFGSNVPGAYSVKISTINNLVYINQFAYITFKGLSFKGASINTFLLNNSQNISIQNCDIDLSGSNAIVASSSANLAIENTTINHSLNDAINLDMGCVSASIRNNTIKNTALIEGMGNSGTGTYEAITSFGNNSLIEFNKIDSTGYNGIYFGGNYSVVKNNLITNFCLTKDDGAGIYVGDWSPWVGKKIIGNIILNGKGAPKGTDRPDYLPAEGIYVDDRTANAAISGNTVANCADGGIKIHNAHDLQINHNTVFNNNIQLLMAHDNIAAASPLRNITSHNNILFSKFSAQLCLNIYSVQDDIISTGNIDSNYYCRPINDNKVIQTTSKIWSSSSITKNLSLSEWQTQYNKDAHSKKTPVTLTDINLIRFEYNASASDKTITLNAPYIGVDSAVYLQSVSLKPYTSIILIRIPHTVTRNFSFSASDVTVTLRP